MARIANRYREIAESPKEIPKYMVGVYARLSVDRDEKKSESIETQVDLIKTFIQKQNHLENRSSELVIYDVYSDLGKTGTNFERSDFERLMKDVRSGNVNCVIVKDFSRFGRNYIEAGNYIEKIFPFLNVRFISVSDQYDSFSTDSGSKELAMNIKNLVNDMYAKDISKKLRTSKHMSQKYGDYVGSLAPYGYQCVEDSGQHKLIVEEEAASIVRCIFQSYVDGLSIRSITEYLFQNKVHRPSDYRKYHHVFCQEGEMLHEWGNSTIRSVLIRNNYYGDLVQHKYESRFSKGQKWCEVLDENHWVIVENVHEAIISEELFTKAQKRIKQAKDARNSVGWDESERAFYNVCFCGDCGRKMATCRSKDTVEYFCQAVRYRDGRRCTAKYISENALQKIVRAELTKQFRLNKVHCKDMSAISHKIFQEKIEELEKEKGLLEIKWADYSKCAADAYLKYKEGELTQEAYWNEKQIRADFKIFKEERSRYLDCKIKRLKNAEKEETKFLRSLVKVNSCKKLNQELVECLVERIDVYGNGQLEITFKMKGV